MKTRFKDLLIILTIQFIFSCIDAYLISKISLIGKIGIRYMYKEYGFLRSGWKTIIVFFLVQAIVAGLLWYITNRFNKKIASLACIISFAIAVIGLIMTYNDFQHTYTHRLLKERFHLGFYLFWLGWMGTTVYFAVKNLAFGNSQPQALDKSQIPAS